MDNDFHTYLKVYIPSFYEEIKVEYLRFKNEFKMIERQKEENAIPIKRLSDEKQQQEIKETRLSCYTISNNFAIKIQRLWRGFIIRKSIKLIVMDMKHKISLLIK